MRLLIVGSLLALSLSGSPLQAQEPAPPTDSSEPATPLPPPPTPEQQHYLQGLRTAGRGVAQVKDGVDRVTRSQSSKDTLYQTRSARRLAGLCGAARGFLQSGRGQMQPTAYQSPTRQPARELALQVDSLVLAVKECQQTAGKRPQQVSAVLVGRLRAYETALAAFRTAIGLPNR
jgi:hypothetical protein